ncbi:MAG: ribosome alternative rescue factor ArfA [Psychrobium sp.]|nr:ribosome alternative rescue factor ArfA [Psychrobium sp.]
MKKVSNKQQEQQSQSIDIGRGVIKSNYLAALVTSSVFKTQVVTAKKGKGSFKRNNKHKGQESYLMAA